SDDQVAALKAKLKARAARDVTIDASTDPNLLGGLIVRIGSQMIDASLKTKLNRLAQAMKG
ncbi:MAG TPA: F0F1 ATP synthase subunit delta, partial [Sphingomicrobium sp.]|nr:F0F1 ATP synthase subunit delta [Sphingomicrobium sp.]